jgi:hypothetical protein
MAVFALLIAGPMVAIATLPALLPQDGPAHMYTGQLLAKLLAGDDWLATQFTIQRFPLPNLLAQALLALVTPLFGAKTAGALVTALTFAALAAAMLLLRLTVRGSEGLAYAIPFALLLALGRLWLLGFWGFLLGSLLFCITCAAWWKWRDALSPWRIIILAVLLIAGWFAHLISFGVTVFAILLLALLAERASVARTLRTAAAILPSLPLVLWYGLVMARQGSFEPAFLRMKGESLSDWLKYAKSLKLLSIATQTAFPFVSFEHPLFVLLAPATTVVLAFILWTVATRRDGTGADEQRTVRPWVVLAAILLLAGAFAPDSFGDRHGGFLRERLFLLGLVSALPAWSLRRSKPVLTGAGLLVAGLLIQTGFVWEYGRLATREIAELRATSASIPPRSRILVIHTPAKTRFAASPTLHAASLAALDRDVVVWNHYQSNLYFFPVNFREPFHRCSEDGSCELVRDAARIDGVIVWGPVSAADEIAARYLRPGPSTPRARLYLR